MATERSGRWLWLVCAVVAADRASKYAIERTTDEGFRRELIPHVAWLVHSTNSGIAFGMFSGATTGSGWAAILLMGTSAAVILVLGWLLVAGRAGAVLEQAGLALIAGGAAGNLLDRILHHGVTDFLELHAGRFEWPAFNVADSSITIGALLILYELLRGKREASGERA